MSTFQAMFSVSLQRSGSLGSSETTPAWDPLKLDHWSAAEAPVSVSRVRATVVKPACLILRPSLNLKLSLSETVAANARSYIVAPPKLRFAIVRVHGERVVSMPLRVSHQEERNDSTAT